MPRVLLVDQHGVYRKGLCVALQHVLPGSQVLESDSLRVARKEFEPDGTLDLVLVDVDAPDASLDVLRSLREIYPKTKLVAMSATGTRAAILQSLDSGLFGFISKSQPDAEIFSAVKDILAGRIYVPLSLSQLDKRARYITRDRHAVGSSVVPDLQPERLTPRQREILPLLAKGMSNKEIARALKIAEGTTKIHASGVLRVLGVRNRTEAAVIARDYVLPHQSMAPLERRSGARRR